MTPEQRATLREAFGIWFRSHAPAVEMCMELVEVAHVWDDLIDRDKYVEPETVDAAFRTLMLSLPVNSFWQANAQVLHPILGSVYMQWTAANVLEKENKPGDRERAFMLRAGLYQLFQTVAACVGGLAWGVEVGPHIYRFYGETVESF